MSDLFFFILRKLLRFFERRSTAKFAEWHPFSPSWGGDISKKGRFCLFQGFAEWGLLLVWRALHCVTQRTRAHTHAHTYFMEGSYYAWLSQKLAPIVIWGGKMCVCSCMFLCLYAVNVRMFVDNLRFDYPRRVSRKWLNSEARSLRAEKSESLDRNCKREMWWLGS